MTQAVVTTGAIKCPVKSSPSTNQHPFFTSQMPLLSPNQQSNSTKGENNIDLKKYYLKMVTIYILEIVCWLAITISVLRAFFFATISPIDSQTIPVFHVNLAKLVVECQVIRSSAAAETELGAFCHLR